MAGTPAPDKDVPMKKNIRFVAYLLTFAVGMWGGNILIQRITGDSAGREAAEAMLDKAAPAFRLTDTEGKQRSSHEWDGKVRVINFWATWCPPCRKETPMFVELQEKYGASGLQFIGIAIDDADKVQDFMDTYGINYPMLIGEDDAIAVAKQYGNQFGALPYTVIIDRSGQIRHVQRGELKEAVAEKTLRPLF